MNIRKLLAVFLLVATFSIVTPSAITHAVDGASSYLSGICSSKDNNDNIKRAICYLQSEIEDLDARVTTLEAATDKHILDAQQVRGSNWETDSTTMTPTPDLVTVNCNQSCTVFVNYDVDTRNTQSSGNDIGFNHIYGLWIDGVDQGVISQVSTSVPNAAYNLALNGGFSLSEGTHTIQVYTQTTGGHLQQFESHLQALAFEQ